MKQGLPNSAQRALASQIAADEHPSADLLTAFAERSLGAAEQKQVTVHLAACPECRDVVFLASAAAPQTAEVSAGDGAVSRWRWLSWKWVVPTVAAVIVIAAVTGPKLYVKLDSRNTVAMQAPSLSADMATSTSDLSHRQRAADQLAANSVAAPNSQPAAANELKDLHKRKDAAPATSKATTTEGRPSDLVKKAEPSQPLVTGRVAAQASGPVRNALVLHQEARDAAAAPAPAPPPPPMIAKAAPAQQTGQPAAAKDSPSAEVTSAAPLVVAQSPEVASAVQSAKPATKSSLAEAAHNSATVPGLMMAKNAAAMPRWRVTSDGQLQRSFDSNQWTRMLPDQAVVFKAVGVVGAQVWAGGSDGALFHSSNGGEAWTRVSLTADGKAESSNIISIRFDSALKGLVQTDSGTTWVTSDGGKSWSKQ